VFAYETRRLLSSAAVPAMLVVPAVVAAIDVARTHSRAVGDVAEVQAGTLATTSSVTAFEAFGSSLTNALLVLAALLAGLASQSLAGETSRGTLRNLLLRPVRRIDAVAGKTAAILAAGLASFVLVCAAAYAAASRWFEWKDVAEILPNGALLPLPGGEASKMWGETARTLVLVLPPLFAFACVGFLAGALVRAPAAAVALALGGAALLFAFGVADDALLHRFVETTRVMSDAKDPGVASHVIVPLACGAAAFGGAAWVLSRRSIK